MALFVLLDHMGDMSNGEEAKDESASPQSCPKCHSSDVERIEEGLYKGKFMCYGCASIFQGPKIVKRFGHVDEKKTILPDCRTNCGKCLYARVVVMMTEWAITAGSLDGMMICKGCPRPIKQKE